MLEIRGAINLDKQISRILKSSWLINQKWAQEMHIASTHHGVSGHFREALWMELFRGIVPQKYALAQGVILIDSDGSQSREVDIAIYDEQYTPYVFRHKSVHFIPIEAVAAVIQCKSEGLLTEELRKWVCSIKKLKTSPCGVARFESKYFTGFDSKIQTGTRPIRVLACTKKYKFNRWAYNRIGVLQNLFDIVLYQVSDHSPSIQVHIPDIDRSLGEWGLSLNRSQSKSFEEQVPLIQIKKQDLQRFNRTDNATESEWADREEMSLLLKNADEDHENYYVNINLSDLRLKENPWLSLNMQLNQLLMLRNNPMLFPHYAYARTFREAGASQVHDKAQKKARVFPIILQNYSYIGDKMATETKVAFYHGKDTSRELWRSYFRSIIPMKFSIDKNVVIMDSEGNKSKELDLVVYDEQYIPYVFQHQSTKYVPIEAVSVIVKLFDGNERDLKELAQWINSLELKTSPIGIARLARHYATGIGHPTQHATRPIRVIISATNIETDKSLDKQLSEMFDFLMYLKPDTNGVERFELKVPHENDHLEHWGKKLNSAEAKIESKDIIEEQLGNPLTLSGLRIEGNPLLTFNLQLNQLLMLINNPMLFPHYAYAELFRKSEWEESE